MEDILMKIWLNGKLTQAILIGLDKTIEDEFMKWDGYPRNPYGDAHIMGEACRYYWEEVSIAMRRQWGISIYTGTIPHFKWSDIL